ncbi:MAG: hypothetical protein ACYDB9_08900 [Gammaproteobacteria bacterium]
MVKPAWLVAVVALFVLPVFAADNRPVSPPPPKVDTALLEFIGTWQTSDGRSVDPMTFARIDPGKLAAEKARREGKPLPSKTPPPVNYSDERGPGA